MDVELQCASPLQEATRVFVVRHAEHVAPSATSLSRRGSLQAAAVAETLKHQGRISAVFSSQRCTETAESIAIKLGVRVFYDERLRNWDSGVLSGLSKAQVQEKLPDIYHKRFVERNPDFKVPQGESLKERYQRVCGVMEDILREHGSEQIVVVTHGGVIDDMFRIACKLPLPQLTGLLKPYGCVSVLLHAGGKWRDEQWAGVDHLPQVVAQSPSGGQLYLFPHQVAGSFPMFRGDRGELCKPATEMELRVYESLGQAYPGLAAFTPTFLGVVEIDVNHILQRNEGVGAPMEAAAGAVAAAASSVARRNDEAQLRTRKRPRSNSGEAGADPRSRAMVRSPRPTPSGARGTCAALFVAKEPLSPESPAPPPFTGRPPRPGATQVSAEATAGNAANGSTESPPRDQAVGGMCAFRFALGGRAAGRSDATTATNVVGGTRAFRRALSKRADSGDGTAKGEAASPLLAFAPQPSPPSSASMPSDSPRVSSLPAPPLAVHRGGAGRNAGAGLPAMRRSSDGMLTSAAALRQAAPASRASPAPAERRLAALRARQGGVGGAEEGALVDSHHALVPPGKQPFSVTNLWARFTQDRWKKPVKLHAFICADLRSMHST